MPLTELQERIITELAENKCDTVLTDADVKDAMLTSMEYYYGYKKHSDAYYPVILAAATYNTLNYNYDCDKITINDVASKYGVSPKRVGNKTLDMMHMRWREWEEIETGVKIRVNQYRDVK